MMTKTKKTKRMTVRKKSRRSSENRTNSSVCPWKSPITSDLIVAQSITLSEARLGGEQVYLLEGRPQELGRFVVVRANSLGGQARDTMPKPYNARTRVVQKPRINIRLSG
jgi:hypothetical protein